MTKPNILLINCDDLGYGDLGCYGSTVNKTPAIDQMAAEGIRFTDFYMASPVCSPSRGAMMTGCYPPRIDFGTFDGLRVLFPGQGIGLSTDETTIAGALKDVGYATKIIGKWHCGDQPEFLPTRHGFDSYYGLPYSNDMGRQIPDLTVDDHSLLETRQNRPPLPLLRDEEVIQEQPDQRGLTERYVEESVRFLRENSETPFFLYLAHMHVHLPLYAAERFVNESENGDYGACVAGIDWATEVLLAELKRLGIDENTLIIFTSDNGSRMQDQGGSNGALRGKKGETWEGGQRVACIMRWPGKIPAGTITNDIASAIDFFPTVAQLTGAEVPSDRAIDGVDISSTMFGESDGGARDTFVYYRGDDLEAVRKGKWKLHFRKDEGEINELYDLVDDIGETINQFDSNPEVVADLNTFADEIRQLMGDDATGVVGQEIRPAARVENPVTLTALDENHPYMHLEYDKAERG